MKHFKNIFSFASLIALFLLSSCLDNTGNLDVFNSVNNKGIISIGQAEPGLNVKTVEISANPVSVSVVVNAARVNKPINVTVEVDPTLLAAYNSEQAALDPAFVPFQLLPSTLYTIPSLVVAIPAGKLDTPFEVQIATATISLTAKYILPIVLKSVDDPSVVIASNLSSSLIAIVVKNRFDGKYTVTGTMVDNVNPNLVGYYPWKAELVTNGGLQNVLQDAEGYFSDPRIHIIKQVSPAAISGYGSFGVTFNFDDANNVVSVINLFGQPASNTRSAKLDPTGINKWDPVTKTLKVKYFMIQTNQATGTNPRVTFDETYTYTGPR
jgi:hypothetical protein